MYKTWLKVKKSITRFIARYYAVKYMLYYETKYAKIT